MNGAALDPFKGDKTNYERDERTNFNNTEFKVTFYSNARQNISVVSLVTRYIFLFRFIEASLSYQADKSFIVFLH